MLDNGYTMALARILLATTYFVGGFDLITGELPIGYAASKGIPSFAVYIAFGVKLVAGFAIIIGFQTRVAAILLAAFTLATAFLFHWPSEQDPYSFGKEIVMVGGLILLAAVGPGALSIDERVASRNNRERIQ
jgi:putative oxidoreductase